MMIYLDNALSNHRHGRFFISQLEAQPVDETLDDGLVLMHGKFFQGMDPADQQTWWSWSSRSGCALLLIPPFNLGAVYEQVDWSICLAESTARSDDGVVPDSVVDEVSQRIEGSDGEFDRGQGHQWSDYTINTRFYKQHSGCGVFAATCLPLWSISLLESADETIDWLQALLAFAGKPINTSDSEPVDTEMVLEPTDYTLMVCLAAWDLTSVGDVKTRLASSETKTIMLSENELAEGFARLSAAGFVNERGLSSAGQTALERSPYWAYTVRLKEESQL